MVRGLPAFREWLTSEMSLRVAVLGIRLVDRLCCLVLGQGSSGPRAAHLLMTLDLPHGCGRGRAGFPPIAVIRSGRTFVPLYRCRAPSL